MFYLPARQILDPFLTLRRQLAAVNRYYAGPGLDALGTLFALDALLDSRPKSLSGGELRRAELALACARQPTCLVADEPFRGIDPRDIDLIARALRSVAESGTAVLVTGHEIAPLRAVADAVVWCVAGTTHEFPDAAAAWADAQLQQDFLGSGR